MEVWSCGFCNKITPWSSCDRGFYLAQINCIWNICYGTCTIAVDWISFILVAMDIFHGRCKDPDGGVYFLGWRFMIPDKNIPYGTDPASYYFVSFHCVNCWEEGIYRISRRHVLIRKYQCSLSLTCTNPLQNQHLHLPQCLYPSWENILPPCPYLSSSTFPSSEGILHVAFLGLLRSEHTNVWNRKYLVCNNSLGSSTFPLLICNGMYCRSYLIACGNVRFWMAVMMLTWREF